MVRLQKSKRVSWPSDVNLCQVRLFLSEDSPSQVGLEAQDNLQVKASWILHSAGVGYDDQLPPGFEGANTIHQLKKEVSQIALVKWQCPPRFVPNSQWRVVAGEESKEAEVQKQREMRVFEAIYPRPSAIPPSPSISLELEDSHYEGFQIPLIPVTSIEDEDGPHTPSDSVALTDNPEISLLKGLPQRFPQKPESNILAGAKAAVCTNEKSSTVVVPGVEPDVVAAASAAFTAIMRSNEQGSLIDHELLIKILNNPVLIEKLIKDYGTAATTQTSAWMSSSMSTSLPGPPRSSCIRVDTNPPLSGAQTSGFYHSAEKTVTLPTLQQLPHPPVQMHVNHPPVKDVNYYKSLIQQHGGEKPEVHDGQFMNNQNQNQRHVGIAKPEQQQQQQHVQSNCKGRDTKTKNKRPCIYFNSSKGCKNGANCAYQHDKSVQQQSLETQTSTSSKRMKVEAGRT